MLRKVLPIVTVILLLPSGAIAIHQYNDYGILAENIVERSNGLGLEHGGRPVMFMNNQRDHDIGSGNIALQSARALIGQHAGAWGRNGTSSAHQIGSSAGYQDQTVGGIWAQYVGHPTVVQEDGLDVSLGEVVYNDGGISGARGVQIGPAHLRQTAVASDSFSRQSQTINPIQFAHAIGRGRDSDSVVVVQTTVDVHTRQSQVH